MVKVLGRLTPVQVFEIKTPVWGGRKVGLATYKIAHHNEIRITTKDKNGMPYYPLPFYISGADARKYPLVPVKSNPNIKLHVIPVSDLETLERED